MQPDRARLVDEGSFQRELSDDSVPLVPGQLVIWMYRPQQQRRKVYRVAAEVVHVSTLRIRIRVRSTSGISLLRWVHPKNLHRPAADEQATPYPDLT
jgi:hypothetical protein